MTWLTCIASNVVLASILALAAWFVQRRLQLASLARILWLLVLVKLVTPPLVDISLIKLPSTMACVLGVCNCPQHAAQTFVGQSWPWILLTAWAVGVAATGWIAFRRWNQFAGSSPMRNRRRARGNRLPKLSAFNFRCDGHPSCWPFPGVCRRSSFLVGNARVCCCRRRSWTS